MSVEDFDGGGQSFYLMQNDEYAMEDNGLHMTAFGAQDNPKAQGKYTITRGWEKFAFPKAVRQLRDTDLKLQQKALLTISVSITTCIVHT